jgi:formate C-acetyltransferase
MEWLARTYVHAMNCIHYMHDKYFYERLEMALHDRDILRTMAFGIAGLSVVADSLSAIKYGKIRVDRDENGLWSTIKRGQQATPQFGNNDDRVDQIASDSSPASWRRSASTRPIATRRTPRACSPSLERGLRQGDGKHAGRPPQGRAVRAGRKPMHGRDSPWLASPPACRSPSFPIKDAQDGISYTVSVRRRRHHCPIRI